MLACLSELELGQAPPPVFDESYNNPECTC